MSNETALAIIEQAAQNGSLIFFDKTNGFPQVELYRTEITSLTINKDSDCFEINKKFMPKREMVDRIGEASGVVFVNGETRCTTIDDSSCGKHTAYIGRAQGKMRMSDGTWRMSSICEYEFDPTIRAMMDHKVTELNAYTKKTRKTYEKDGVSKPYGNTLAEAILEYTKAARQRANTGARLRVIRELTGMSIAFTKEQIEKPVFFGRIVQNTSYILQTPEGRVMATAQALGVDMSTLFGGRKLLDNQASQQDSNTGSELPPDETPPYEGATGSLAAKSAAVNEPDFPDDPMEQNNNGEKKVETEFERLTQTLNEFLESFQDVLDVTCGDGKNPYHLAKEELANSDATEKSRGAMVKRLRTWLKTKGIDV